MHVRSASKLLIVAAMCTLAMACSKKVKEAPPADNGTVGTTQPAIDTAAMGEAAAELLLRRVSDIRAPRREIVLEPKLVVRDSSGGKIA